MMKFSRVQILFVLFVLSNFYSYGQNSFTIKVAHYSLPRNQTSQALLIDTTISTYDINCLNQVDSTHLKSSQVFDSTLCDFMNYYLNIQRNDSVIEQIVFSHNRNFGFSNLKLIEKNVYDVFYKTELSTEFHNRIVISENTISYFSPIRNMFDSDNEQHEMAFDSSNFQSTKYYLNKGFVTKSEYTVMLDGEFQYSKKEITEYSYLFFENSIEVTADNKSADNKNLISISFDSPFGMSAMSKFIFLHIVRNDLVGAAYEVHYPIVLFHFPELLEKLR